MCLFMIPLHFCMMWSCLKLFEMSGRDRRNKLSLSQNHSAPQLHSKYSKNPKTRPAIWGRSKKHLLTHPREAANLGSRGAFAALREDGELIAWGHAVFGGFSVSAMLPVDLHRVSGPNSVWVNESHGQPGKSHKTGAICNAMMHTYETLAATVGKDVVSKQMW